MVPIIWLYITAVVVVISFSIIVLCVFISLLLITVGIIYNRMGGKIEVVINVLFDGENISFDASLVMYINNISIPPIVIMNRMYENQKLLYTLPLIKHTMTVFVVLTLWLWGSNLYFTVFLRWYFPWDTLSFLKNRHNFFPGPFF
jgi:hypothetical protein